MIDLTILAHRGTRWHLLAALLLLCTLLVSPALADPPAAFQDLLRGLIHQVSITNDYKLMRPLIGADDATVSELGKLLRDPQLPGHERFVTAVAFSYVRTPAALTALLANSSDSEPAVRQGVALSLGYFRDETGEIRAALTQLAATDPSTYTDAKTGETRYLVRETAQAALGRLTQAQPLATASATPPVIPVYAATPASGAPAQAASAPAPPAAETANRDLQARLATTIGQAAATNDYSPLRSFLGADDATVGGLAALLDDPALPTRQRYFAAVALSWARTPAALAVLLRHANEANPLVRQGVVVALGAFRDDSGEVRRVLTRLAQDDPASYVDKETGLTRYTIREIAQRSLDNLDKASPMLTPGAAPATGRAVAGTAAPTAKTSPADAAMATAATFLSDPALPAFPECARKFNTSNDSRGLYSRLYLETHSAGLGSYLDVAAAGDQIVDYLAGLPVGPYPDTLMSQAACREIAEQFARRQLPALFAAGDELKCDPEAKLTRAAAYLFNFYRVHQGVPVPPRAVVGVRAYDGKVVRFTPEAQPLSIGTEPKLTLEQAVDSLKGYLAQSGWVPNTMLESTLEVVKFKQQQHLAWTLKLEMKGARNAKEDTLDGFCFCHIDANDGALLDREFPGVGIEMYRWYLSKGGTHHPMIETRLPDSSFEDAYPLPSPDGKRVLFYSTRPRAGYPEWLEHRPSALCMVNADGSNLTCLVPVDAAQAAWGPKSDRVAYLNKDIIVIDLSTGQRVTFPADRDHQYFRFLWLPDGRLLALSHGRQGMTPQLSVLDPAQPQVPSVELLTPAEGGAEFAGLAVDQQGRLLYTTKAPLDATPGADEQRNRAPYSLYRVDLTQAQPQPELLASLLVSAQRPILSPDGKVYFLGLTSTTHQVVDLASKQVSSWQFPRVACPDSTFRTAVYSPITDLSFAPDGSLLFSADYFSGKAGDPRAQVIYACAADGSAARLVTKPETQNLTAYVFPGGK